MIGAAQVKVRVFIWFDVEDYVTPESDIALGRVLEILGRHGCRATLKLVGEKVRGLQRRGHHDILAALRSQDIGYHTDYHSKPPTVAQYALEGDWAGGVAEFMRRERNGLETLTGAFGRRPTCYGQPGGSWAPHVYPALRTWDIPVYLDAGPWVGLDGSAHRYCGILNLMRLQHTYSIGISRGLGAVQERSAQLGQIVQRMQHTGGEISLYAHECEFVTSEFWDAVNYGRGRDTPRSEWKPAALRSTEDTEERYAALEYLLRAMASFPNTDHVVSSQAPALYPDRAATKSFSPAEIARLGESMIDQVTHQRCDGAWLSPAEVLSLVVRLLAERARAGSWPEQVPYRYIDGPTGPPHVESTGKALAQDDVFGTCLYESASMDLHGQMPTEVQVGRTWLSPAGFLATIGAVLPRWVAGDDADAALVRGQFSQAAYIPDHVPWDWVVFPPDFSADGLLPVAKLQAWTLKPASAA